jgi:8-oxo-dGTP diphosphatase
MEREEIVAAGAVVSRKGPEVLLVHRPKYDDWSFPKGKLDPGEHPLTAAVREVAEETGLDVHLGPPLPDHLYEVGNGTPRTKRVHWWTARVAGCDDVSGYRANNEIDALEWVDPDEARRRLTWDRDRELLDEWARVRGRSTPLVVLRHGEARSRKAWRGDDRERTLTKNGELQAEELVPLLGAYGVQRVVSSSSRRCWSTLAPYADVADVELEETHDLAEEDATETAVTELTLGILASKEPTVVCTHRPVLPLVFAALGVRDPGLGPGDMLVVHHRRGQVVALEHHAPRE